MLLVCRMLKIGAASEVQFLDWQIFENKFDIYIRVWYT